MTVAVNQAHALLATISELPRQEARDRAIGLAKELLASGEWRLCLDLCDAVRPVADEPGRLVECELIRADALMGMTEFSKALVILEATSEIARQGASSIPLTSAHLLSILRARALWLLHRVGEAKRILEKEEASLLALPESSELGWCSLILGNVAWIEGDLMSARRRFHEAAVSAHRVQDARLSALALINSGQVKRQMCHWSEARSDFADAYEQSMRLGNHAQIAHVLRSMAIVDWRRGRLEAARLSAERAAKLASSTGIADSVCYSLELLALTELHAGEYDVARRTLQEVLGSSGAAESVRVALLLDEFHGDICLDLGEVNEALLRFDSSLRRATAVAPRGDIVAELRRRRAECFYLLGRHDEAYAEAKLGLEHTRELGDRYEEAATYRIAALSAAALKRPEEAKQLFEQGFALFDDIETPYEWGKLWMAFGDWLASDRAGSYRDPRMAIEAYHAAHYRFDAMGAKAKLAEVNARIARDTPRPADAILVHDLAAPSSKNTPPRPRPSRSRSRAVDQRTEWAREHFGVITANPAIFEILEIVEKLARSRSAVLVLGESGTGKELIAQALHKLSGRKGEFMAINCATLPKDVIESELFGHVAGAFTGANREKVGLLEVCEGGTVFLDEVSEMSLDLQSRLLRFLESGEIRRVGATRIIKITTRIVAASNREEIDLRSGQGFRPDLFYRLAHTIVKLPALRLRGARDIELLAEYFLGVSCAEEQKSLTLSEGALRKLAMYTWPGNIRELRSTMSQRAVLASDGHEVQADDLRLEAELSSVPGTLEEELAQTERRRIEEALRMSGNSKADAARLLGMPRTTLINRMQRLGIQSE